MNQFISYKAQVQHVPGAFGGGYKLVPNFRFASAVRLPASYPAQTWDVPGLNLRFAPGTSLTTAGVLNASGTTFTASSSAWGWSGIRFTPGAVGTLSGVTVSGARSIVNPQVDEYFLYPPISSVSAYNATVTITGASQILGGSSQSGSGGSVPTPGSVIGANGVFVDGPAALVTIKGGSRITGNGGFGVVVVNGAPTVNNVLADRVVLRDDATTISGNGYGGVLSVGTGSWLRVGENVNIDANFGPGAQVVQGGHIPISSPAGASNTSVSFNQGGLVAYGPGSLLDARTCGPLRPNVFEGNDQNRTLFDARAFYYSQLGAPSAFWGVGRTLPNPQNPKPTDLILLSDNSSTLDVPNLVNSIAASLPPCGNADAERGAGGAARRSAASPGAQRTLDLSASVVRLVYEARTTALDGDIGGAFAMLTGAEGLIATEDDRGAVFAATGALLAESQPAAVVAVLEATADGAGPNRLWARQALVLGYAASGREMEADALALGLTAEPAHAAFGHQMRVEWATAARDTSEALGRLAAFASSVSATDTLGVEALSSSFALVAASFPEADLSGITSISLGRGVAGRSGLSEGTAARSAFVSSEDASRGGAAAVEDGVDVYPNPAAGRASVRVSVAEAAQRASVMVYDALGRRVSVLHDGPLAAGAHALPFDASTLPAGVYVVQVRVTPEGGGSWTEVRRLTLTR